MVRTQANNRLTENSNDTMNDAFTETLLQGYYYGTLPLRRLNRIRLERAERAPIAMLFYHRVDDERPNGWTISRAGFRRQIDWLQKHCEIISLTEAQRRIVAGRNDRLATCITFDDGYADNCKFALPLLIERNLPFTYFVSLSFIVEQKPFPHDLLRGEPLAPNSIDDIRHLSNQGIDIGAHTRTHADLAEIRDEHLLYDEMIASRNELSDLIGRDVPYFAFPFGQRVNLSKEAFYMAKQAGIRGVCSAYGGYNYPTDDGFHFHRLHADPMFWRTINWLSLDPRIHRISRYDPGFEMDFETTSLPYETASVR